MLASNKWEKSKKPGAPQFGGITGLNSGAAIATGLKKGGTYAPPPPKGGARASSLASTKRLSQMYAPRRSGIGMGSQLASIKQSPRTSRIAAQSNPRAGAGAHQVAPSPTEIYRAANKDIHTMSANRGDSHSRPGSAGRLAPIGGSKRKDYGGLGLVPPPGYDHPPAAYGRRGFMRLAMRWDPSSSAVRKQELSTTSRYLSYWMIWAIAKMKCGSGKKKRRKAFYNRALDSDDLMSGDVSVTSEKKSAEDEKLIMTTTKQCSLFQTLDDHQRSGLVEAFHLKHFKKGEVLFRKGDEAQHFYIIRDGEFDIMDGGARMETEMSGQSLAKKQEMGRVLRTLGHGAYFGEIALLYSCPRSATVVAKSDSTVWEIGRAKFQFVLRSTHFRKHAARMEFMQSVPVLQKLSLYQRSAIAQALRDMEFRKGNLIVKQGENPGDNAHFYIIKDGECECTVLGDSGKIVKTLKKGDYFGEVTLLRNCPYTATIESLSTPTRLLALPRSAFERILGPVEKVLSEKMTSYKYEADLSKGGAGGAGAKAAPVKSAEKKKEDKEKARFKGLTLKDLRVTKMLGKGMFGMVRLAREIKTQQQYALKVMEKLMVINLDQVSHVRQEADIQRSLRHPFIVNLFATFQDRHNLYLLLEYVRAGDLFDDMQDKEVYNMATARFYAAQVLLALEYLHNEKIVYRDLKPENILMTSKGHLKLADFGLAKQVEDKTWTLCGTPEYVAPEILTGQGHSTSVDWWSYGVLIYEMMFGEPPFNGDNRVALYGQICRGEYEIPPEAPPEAADLIRRLLTVDVTRRLGCMHGGATDIKKHPFFRGMDWEAMYNRAIPVPHVPSLDTHPHRKGDDVAVDLEKSYRNKPAPASAQQALFEGF
eukprot:Rmarinus@m.8431